jgi:hypothetical protein
MGRFSRLFAWAFALTINAPAGAHAGAATLHATGTPPGFGELASEREALVDVYFGGGKVGEALATTRPGILRFRNPEALAARLPRLIAAPELLSALSADLPTNSAAVCSVSNSSSCGRISPQVLGIIYDEDHFRVDVFVNPRFLQTAHVTPTGYLPLPDAPLSFTNALGVAASGTIGGASFYNLQNRTIVALRNARIIANSSIASHLGLVVDDLVAQVDRRDLRYSGGLFWAPGNDFTGQRRIAGLGVGTQFDTFADRDELHATPLIVFLGQAARVELVVDGRLVGSRSYPPGNVAIDTSALGDGSYPVLLRIHEANGSIREERRFFVKNAQVAPLGHPIFYAYAGMLANTRRKHPVSLSKDFYYQAGTAWRLNNQVAVDASVTGTQHKTILEAGGWLIRGAMRLRAAGLVSSAGDSGALLQLASGGHGPLNLSFDLRRISSRNGKPLIPLPSVVDTFGVTPPTGVQLAEGSYTQATASLGLRLGEGYVALVGSYRKDRRFKADYSIGPSVNWPLVTRNRVQLVFEASAQRTRTSTAAFAGVRALFTAGRMSVLGRLGEGHIDERADGERSITRIVGTLNAQYSYEDGDRTLVTGEAGFDRDVRSSTVHAGGTVDSRFGSVRADILRSLEGNRGTQYDLSYQSAAAFAAHASAWGGRDLDQSAISVRVSGDARGAAFDVLVDNVSRGKVKAGQRLSIFLAPYRTYAVRLVPTGASPVSYDTSEREVTLYPGNLRSLVWLAQSYVTIFGRAVAPDGTSIANALVHGPKSVGETDSNGYFQLDVRKGDPITMRKANGAECRIELADMAADKDFAPVGEVICR